MNGTYDHPLLISPEELDLTGLRAHFKAMHRRGQGRTVPRRNRDLAGEHARQHHRLYQDHIHEGPLVMITHNGRRPVGVSPRPLGWYTGQQPVTRAELHQRFLARRAAR